MIILAKLNYQPINVKCKKKGHKLLYSMAIYSNIYLNAKTNSLYGNIKIIFWTKTKVYLRLTHNFDNVWLIPEKLQTRC